MHPNIDNLLRTLRCQTSHGIPMMELGIHPKIKSAILGREIVTLKDEIAFWYSTGYDYVKLQPGVQFNVGNTAARSDRNETRLWAAEGEGIIVNEETFEMFDFPAREIIDYTKFDTVSSFLPEGMGVIAQYGDIFTMTWELMGFENFAMALFENPSLVVAINKKLGDVILSMFEYFCQHPAVHAIWYSDDIAYNNGLMVSPEVLNLLFFPWIEQIGKLAGTYNKPFIYHSDGDITPVIEQLIEANVNALHPIEPGVLSLTGLKKIAGDRMCLIGNFDVDILARDSKESIQKLVRNTLQSMADENGYCAGSGNSIPDYVPVANYLTMINEIKQFNKLTS